MSPCPGAGPGILRRAIEAGEYPPGELLPSQTQIMQTYGVARMTASRAVAQLVSEGLVVTVPGLGAYVKPDRPA